MQKLADIQQAIPRVDRYANGQTVFPANLNVRLPLDVYPKEAPDPVRDGEFWQEGKPFSHAWAHATLFVSTAISAILSVDAWPADGFRAAKYVRENIVRTPLGVQAAFIERANIERPKTRAYGSQQYVPGQQFQTIDDLRVTRPR